MNNYVEETSVVSPIGGNSMNDRRGGVAVNPVDDERRGLREEGGTGGTIRIQDFQGGHYQTWCE